MNQYRRGREFEYDVVHDLTKRGYTAQRTAGSHSPVDVFAVPNDGPGLLFVQAKLGNMTRSARAEFFAFCVRAHACSIIATKERGSSEIHYHEVLPDGGLVVIDGDQPIGKNVGGCTQSTGKGEETE